MGDQIQRVVLDCSQHAASDFIGLQCAREVRDGLSGFFRFFLGFTRTEMGGAVFGQLSDIGSDRAGAQDGDANVVASQIHLNGF